MKIAMVMTKVGAYRGKGALNMENMHSIYIKNAIS